jgi:HAD superfamily hydrolase (TIGR01509 family)
MPLEGRAGFAGAAACCAARPLNPVCCAGDGSMSARIQGVIFDLDGLLLDSEQLWDEAREELAREQGGRWHDRAQQDMMGMSSPEWSTYMHERIGLPEPPEEINTEVVRTMEELYRRQLPLIDGAVEAVQRLAARWPLGLASSSNRELIDLVLELSGLARFFRATVSSEEVAHGKPAPDVYFEAARRLGAPAADCAAIEDSHNGIRSAKAAGMRVVVVPNPHFPPDEDALALADVVLRSLGELTPEVVEEPA